MFKNFWVLIAAAAFVFFRPPGASADVVIKVRALNPLDTQEIAVVQYPLPKEISQEHILRQKITYSLDHSEDKEPPKSNFQISFDEESGGHYIDDEIPIAPKEVITLEVHVKDVWMIERTRIEGLKDDVDGLLAAWEEQMEDLSESVEGQDVETKEFALTMKDEILNKLDTIVQRQEKSSIIKAGVERHIEAFENSMEDLRQVQQDMVLLANLIQFNAEESEPLVDDEEIPGDEDGEPEETQDGGEEILEVNDIGLEDIQDIDPDQIVMEEAEEGEDQKGVEGE